MSPNLSFSSKSFAYAHLNRAGFSDHRRQSLGLTKQRGSMLVMALVVLTVIMVFALSLSATLDEADQQITLEVWGTRALFAANSGADAALAQLFPLSGALTTDCSAVSSSWTPPSAVGFANCQVNLSCDRQTVNFNGMDIHQFTLTSAATCEAGVCDGAADSSSRCLRVNRQVEIQARVE